LLQGYAVVENLPSCSNGFPQALELHKISNSAYENYLKGLYTTILEKDIKPRNQIYNELAFDNLMRFLSDSVGSPVSANSIANYFIHTKDGIEDKTISRYISILNKSYLFYHAIRFDLKGKKILKTQGKEYIVAKDPAGYLYYYQVCLTMRNEATRERELSAFIKLKNHHPKMVITLDPEEPTYNGIVQKNATKWLIER
jgi:predicted AAA+ superfamily ATPase